MPEATDPIAAALARAEEATNAFLSPDGRGLIGLLIDDVRLLAERCQVAEAERDISRDANRNLRASLALHEGPHAIVEQAFFDELLADQVRYRELKSAIEKHRAQKGDDRCWLDDQELYESLGDDNYGDNRVGDIDAMLVNCKRFLEKRCQGGTWQSYTELAAERDRLAKRVEEAERITDRIRGMAQAGWSVTLNDLDILAALLAPSPAASTPKETPT